MTWQLPPITHERQWWQWMTTTNDNEQHPQHLNSPNDGPCFGGQLFIFFSHISFAQWALPHLGVFFSFFFCSMSAGPQNGGQLFVFPFSFFCSMSTTPICGFLFFSFSFAQQALPPFGGLFFFSFFFCSMSAGPHFGGWFVFIFYFCQQVLAPVLGPSSFFIFHFVNECWPLFWGPVHFSFPQQALQHWWCKSTGNLHKHAKILWGEEVVAAAVKTCDVQSACEALGKLKSVDSLITAAFQWVTKGKITYSHRQHTTAEAHAKIVNG